MYYSRPHTTGWFIQWLVLGTPNPYTVVDTAIKSHGKLTLCEIGLNTLH